GTWHVCAFAKSKDCHGASTSLAARATLCANGIELQFGFHRWGQMPMRGALHLLCTLVLLPYLLLAAWFLILGDAISGGSLASFLTTLLSHALWLIPWGLLGFTAGIVAVAALGMIEGMRWLGGLCLFVLAGGCLFIVIAGN